MRREGQEAVLRDRLDRLAELATLTESPAQLDRINAECEKITRELVRIAEEE